MTCENNEDIVYIDSNNDNSKNNSQDYENVEENSY